MNGRRSPVLACSIRGGIHMIAVVSVSFILRYSHANGRPQIGIERVRGTPIAIGRPFAVVAGRVDQAAH